MTRKPTPMEKMDSAMRQLLAVPKSVINRREAAYKARRKKHRAK